MSETKALTHLDREGKARMVDVSDKDISERIAIAQGLISMSAETLDLIRQGGHKKGDVFTVAKIAGIQAAKKCADLIPLCHPLALNLINVDLEIDKNNRDVVITATCKLNGKTGVEMEALTAVSVAALTVYDMCKAADKTMVIGNIHLLKKSGGRSGEWNA
ncbi:MAG TPA: cyclic pyranopterin monophosphate synthase MoaC [Pseudomonadales bacterium]|jgi:cyclic pyranopterin phosphate synthase|nr:cyclic pyranopterin monophosphate synthase MoaC [Gammaproteobacteria bacterium]MDP6027763.1 cyclic pyranopterin monophosphate synthase MoaC [Pseudomonadales bacterium]MDP6315421.1 cyclic pyranopterin monophosphate synthase MoaC [Pseudomonadales bacterium]MDP7315123.1 cyclic pyranopterin monophosphate synthase MoaC [Pseudomonadales bacterium]MDP7577434.1 cyclic pyranopterin monophosphate synthase MoaC [Pseudomonadales bacterium]|tara:strand:+ start:768 stop:1250 length:483 start_codon:yes stop_codon:yes gene_type:complete